MQALFLTLVVWGHCALYHSGWFLPWLWVVFLLCVCSSVRACAVCASLLGSVWLCNLLDCCRPGSSVHGISQARILEWVAISSSRGSSQPRNWTSVSSRWILYHWATHQYPTKYLRQNFYRSPEFLVLGVFFSLVLCPTDSSNFAFRGSQIHLHSSELPPACLGGFLVSHSLQRLTDLL